MQQNFPTPEFMKCQVKEGKVEGMVSGMAGLLCFLTQNPDAMTWSKALLFMVSIGNTFGVAGPNAIVTEILVHIHKNGALDLEDYYTVERVRSRIGICRLGPSCCAIGNVWILCTYIIAGYWAKVGLYFQFALIVIALVTTKPADFGLLNWRTVADFSSLQQIVLLFYEIAAWNLWKTSEDAAQHWIEVRLGAARSGSLVATLQLLLAFTGPFILVVGFWFRWKLRQRALEIEADLRQRPRLTQPPLAQ